jgi:hypothetical protein
LQRHLLQLLLLLFGAAWLFPRQLARGWHLLQLLLQPLVNLQKAGSQAGSWADMDAVGQSVRLTTS